MSVSGSGEVCSRPRSGRRRSGNRRHTSANECSSDRNHLHLPRTTEPSAARRTLVEGRQNSSIADLARSRHTSGRCLGPAVTSLMKEARAADGACSSRRTRITRGDYNPAAVMNPKVGTVRREPGAGERHSLAMPTLGSWLVLATCIPKSAKYLHKGHETSACQTGVRGSSNWINSDGMHSYGSALDITKL
jgi:hypothetical protein